MLVVYSLILAIGFLLMMPLFLVRREKYAAGFEQRLGKYPRFTNDGRKVVWLHCVSVGEANAARSLVDALLEQFPAHRLVVSTTTKTGHEHSSKIFDGKADAVFYFPFDFRFSVRKALANYKPSVVLLMETEIWPRFIREAKRSGVKISIVNGRLSARSVKRYAMAHIFVKRVLQDVDLALMQNETDAERIVSLGIAPDKVIVTGNLKFDHNREEAETSLTSELRRRFGFDGKRPLVVAASTHDSEEEQVLAALDAGRAFRLLIAPRHPERFDSVAKLIGESRFSFARRSEAGAESDRLADIVLLDSIGELRAVYPLADLVFVGGSLIPHGGQSILEPAAAGKAIITGPHTENFAAVVGEFLARDAIVQTWPSDLRSAFVELLDDPRRRDELGKNALAAMEANRGATAATIAELGRLFR